MCGNGYGACLMKEAGLVQQLAAAVRANVPEHVEVSVKHRLGVDECDSWEELVRRLGLGLGLGLGLQLPLPLPPPLPPTPIPTLTLTRWTS